MEEMWKDIKEYEGLYQISNLGRVKSLPQLYNRILKQGYIEYFTSEKIIGINNNKIKYSQVTLVKNGIKKYYKIHRLVALNFITNPLNKKEVNHINGIKNDNRVENLEWATSSENQIHAVKTGLQKPIKGKNNKRSKRIYQYSLDNIFIKEWDCLHEVERILKIRRSGITYCANGIYKQAGGFVWSYILF